MKRWLLAIFLVTASSLLAGTVYSWLARPAALPERCTMDWLAGELKLTDAQYARVWALHTKLCPEIGRLGCTRGTADGVRQCRLATDQLIDAVCAELTPAQRTEYLALVAQCRACTRAAACPR